MQKLFLVFGVVVILLLSAFAQRVGPVTAPADALLALETEGDAHQFRLGELVPLSSPTVQRLPANISG